MTVNITFRPQKSSGGKTEEETLIMKIIDGTERKMK